MKNHWTKLRADRATLALKHVTVIQASIAALADEDLLDLADIFAATPATPLARMAAAEMTKRRISL